MNTELETIAPATLTLPANAGRFNASIGDGGMTLQNCEVVPGKTLKNGTTTLKVFYGSDAKTADMMRDLREKIAANKGISKTQARRELSTLLRSDNKGAVNARITMELAIAANLLPKDNATSIKIDAAGNMVGVTLSMVPVAKVKEGGKVETLPAPAPTLASLAKGKSVDELTAMMLELSALAEQVESQGNE